MYLDVDGCVGVAELGGDVVHGLRYEDTSHDVFSGPAEQFLLHDCDL